ncbi:hypothetical protein, partial [Nocardia asiatica]
RAAAASATQSPAAAARTRATKGPRTRRDEVAANEHRGVSNTSFTVRLRAGTVPDVQRVYFWFSKPALGGLVCGNRVR